MSDSSNFSNANHALVAGIVNGLLLKGTYDGSVPIEVEPQIDDNGDYLPEVLVTTKSGETFLVVVMPVVN